MMGDLHKIVQEDVESRCTEADVSWLKLWSRLDFCDAGVTFELWLVDVHRRKLQPVATSIFERSGSLGTFHFYVILGGTT